MKLASWKGWAIAYVQGFILLALIAGVAHLRQWNFNLLINLIGPLLMPIIFTLLNKIFRQKPDSVSVTVGSMGGLFTASILNQQEVEIITFFIQALLFGCLFWAIFYIINSRILPHIFPRIFPSAPEEEKQADP